MTIDIISSSSTTPATNPSSPVNVLSRRAITCNDPTELSPYTSDPDSKFYLGPLDELVSPSVPIAVVYVYDRPTTTGLSKDFFPADKLETATTKTLDYYPHLTGRLRLFDGPDRAPFLHKLGTGAELIFAQSEDRIEDLLGKPENGGSSPPSKILQLPDEGNALLPPFEPWPQAVQEAPLLVIQHTRFACGGVALGVRIHHIVCDAEGFTTFVQDLSEMYGKLSGRDDRRVEGTGEPTGLAKEPTIRSFLAGIKNGADDGFEPKYFDLLPEPANDEDRDEDYGEDPNNDGEDEIDSSAYMPTPVTGKFIHFPRQRLDALKLEASTSGWTSTFEVLTAYLFQTMYRARLQARQDEVITSQLSETDILTPINMRGKMREDDIPGKYFPNALFCLSSEIPVDVLRHGSVGDVARCLHDMLAVNTPTLVNEAERSMRWIARQPDKQRIKHVFRFGTGSLLISQWNKLGMYERATFDDAQPRLVSTPFTMVSLVDGLAYLLSVGTTGAIEVAIALEDAVWERMSFD